LAGPLFEKHASVYCGIDEYMQYSENFDEPRRVGVGDDVKMHQNTSDK
jgi:hypothetical protein